MIFSNDNADEFVVERISEKGPLPLATQTTVRVKWSKEILVRERT